QRLVVGEGIKVPVAVLEASRHRAVTAIPRRNGALGITGALGAQRGQGGVELGGFLGAHRRAGGTYAQRQHGKAKSKSTNIIVMHDQASERVGSIQGNEIAVAIGLLVGLDAGGGSNCL